MTDREKDFAGAFDFKVDNNSDEQGEGSSGEEKKKKMVCDFFNKHCLGLAINNTNSNNKSNVHVPSNQKDYIDDTWCMMHDARFT